MGSFNDLEDALAEFNALINRRNWHQDVTTIALMDTEKSNAWHSMHSKISTIPRSRLLHNVSSRCNSIKPQCCQGSFNPFSMWIRSEGSENPLKCPEDLIHFQSIEKDLGLVSTGTQK